MSPARMSLKERIEAVKPALQQMVREHETGSCKEGVEALNSKMTAMIKSSGLLEEKVCKVDQVGVFPGNREGAMLVPVDVQDLLLRFAQNGFNSNLWQGMAMTIPAGTEGQSWRDANEQLVARSDNLLPAIHGDSLELVTGRGSHGTAALRCMKIGSCRSIHPELAGPGGDISINKVLELQPSFRQPLEEGVVYQVIPGELELAVPGLFQVLSRVGNASNSVFRLQTTLQHCTRIHSLATAATASDCTDWDHITKLATVGMDPDFSKDAHKLVAFVRAWSGGIGGEVLKELESYEKTLTVRRKLAFDDLEALSKLELVQAPRIVPATRSHYLRIGLVSHGWLDRCMLSGRCFITWVV